MDNQRQGMVNWFSLAVLWDALKRSILSKLFGQYADPRLLFNASITNNAKNTLDDDEANYLNQKNEVWLDYVADVGDGYNSTYTIAYLLGKKYLKINNENLPQGDILIMGGDQVYPTPTRENYILRTTNLYSDAYPDQGKENRKPLYVLPGNHDWYDGLRLFSSFFCSRGKQNQFGQSNWKLPQERSYFFIKLPNNWRILGIDTQLECDIDKTQADYFLTQLKDDEDHKLKKIIICVSEPSWLTANLDERYKRGLQFITNNIIKASYKTYQICSVISGDLHHYARYKELNGTEFITAGGGGAFLHPTHSLNETVTCEWQSKPIELTLECTYPSKEDSLRESKKIWWKFTKNNWKFGFILGFVFTLASLLLTATSTQPVTFFALLKNPLTVLFLTLFVFIFCKYDRHLEYQKKKGITGVIHGILHFLCLLGCILFWPYITSVSWMPWGYSTVLLIIVSAITLSISSGFIFGVYLWYSSFFLHRKDNDSFSSLRLDTYKNFLKIKITKDELTIYPIGVTKPLDSNNWIKNSTESGAKIFPNPDLVKHEALLYNLIEKPIIISITNNDDVT